LLTTHYLDEAEQLASRLVVLAGGRVVADTTPGQLRGSGALPSMRPPLAGGTPPGDPPGRRGGRGRPPGRPAGPAARPGRPGRGRTAGPPRGLPRRSRRAHPLGAL